MRPIGKSRRAAAMKRLRDTLTRLGAVPVTAPTPRHWVWDARAGIEGWWEDDEPADPFGPEISRAEWAAIRERDEAAYWARQRGGG
jgi:hypothetical protein